MNVRSEPRRGLAVIPDFPWRIPALVNLFELLAVFEGVHRHPEPVMFVCREASGADQPLERLAHELFTVADVVEDLGSEHEKSAVDSNRCAAHLLDFGDASAVSDRHQMVAEVRFDA